jgi:hypothetical protein
MLIHFGIGGLVLQLLVSTSVGQGLVSFPREPRLALLQNPVAWALASVLLVDAFYYGYHRIQHAVPLLWRIHQLHHTDPAVNVTTARRTHFLERTLQFLFVNLPMLWALGVNIEGSLYATGIMWLMVYGGHANVRLDLGWLTPILVGPSYHRLHHGRALAYQDTNFAQVLPETARRRRRRHGCERLRYGVRALAPALVVGVPRYASNTITWRAASPLRRRSNASLMPSRPIRAEIISSSRRRPSR